VKPRRHLPSCVVILAALWGAPPASSQEIEEPERLPPGSSGVEIITCPSPLLPKSALLQAHERILAWAEARELANVLSMASGSIDFSDNGAWEPLATTPPPNPALAALLAWAEETSSWWVEPPVICATALEDDGWHCWQRSLCFAFTDGPEGPTLAGISHAQFRTYGCEYPASSD
jgi:hypothetical protein